MKTKWTEYRGNHIALVDGVVIGHVYNLYDIKGNTHNKKAKYRWTGTSFFVSHFGLRTFSQVFETPLGAKQWVTKFAKEAQKDGWANFVSYNLDGMKEYIDQYCHYDGKTKTK